MAPSDLRVSEVPDLVPGDGEVLVRVRAAGVNFFDTLIIQGRYQEKPAFPFFPGGEIAGEVESIGTGIQGIAPGARVMAYVGHGGFAERVVVPARAVYPVPETMTFEEAAAFPIVYGTAYTSVVQRGAARSGETVVVTAAAGGVGIAAVQIAKAVGTRVIALASGDKLDVAKGAGADVAIDYRQEGWTEAVREATFGTGADLIVENVGGDVFDGCLRCIAWGGRLVVVGFASGRIPEVRMNRVLLKHIALIGVHFGPMREHEPESVRAAFRALATLYAAGKIRPVVSRVLPMARVAEALEMLGNRSTTGKIVLVP